MNTSLTRKRFLLGGGIAALATLLPNRILLGQAPAPTAGSGARAPSTPKLPPVAPERVEQFVIAGHFDLPKVKEMLAAEPWLINATWDWGKGDFETALGGASHMGRRDIAEYLLEHNARMDIFAATMLGKLDIVKAAVAAFPNIVRVPGPHTIPLVAHAEKGGPQAVAVLEFLRPLVS